MPTVEVLKLALEAFGANKLRAALTMLGLIIGVAAVVLLVSIGTGAQKYITNELEQLGTNLIIIHPGKSAQRSAFNPAAGTARERLTRQDVDALFRHSYNLEAVTGLLVGPGTTKTELASHSGTVIGANQSFPKILNIRVEFGDFISSDDESSGRRVVVLGYVTAQNLFPSGNPLGQVVRVNNSPHRVVGVLAKAGEVLGFNMDSIAVVPTAAAMRIFNEEKLFGIRAKAKDRVAIEDAVAEISEILKRQHNGQEDFTIQTQVGMMQSLNTILDMLTWMLGGIAMVSMLVGGIGIMNIMLVSVTERTREIGIRRAVGARQRDVLKQFLAEAVMLSFIGGMIGLIGAFATTHLVTFFVDGFDMRAPVWILVPAFGLSCMTGVIFGVWPAMRAARIETIEALRTE